MVLVSGNIKYVSIWLPQDDIVLSSKYGQLYRCSYTSALQAEKTRRNMNDDVNEDQQSVVELLKPLETASCLIHVRVKYSTLGQN